MKNKLGVSPVIATILLVGLAVVLIGVVWTIVNNLVQDQTQQASACFGVLDKVILNEKYTCYYKAESILQVSIDIRNVDVESLLVSIEGQDSTKTFELSNTSLVREGVYNAEGTQDNVVMPKKNGGKNYLLDATFGIEIPPRTIKISPKIKGYQCEVSSTMTQIGEC
ncbi:Uncharacterised protein [uncultured archaeon]|nr:Uncharacterised protein [uncultured archaeon]